MSITAHVEQAAAPRRPATVRIARWSATHPWRAISLWLVFLIACLAVGQLSHLRTATDLDTSTGQSGQALRLLHDGGLVEPAVEHVLITGRGGGLDGSTARAAAADVSHRLAGLPEVASVSAPTTSKDGSALLVDVTMRGDPEDASDHVGPLLDATAAVQHDYPSLRVEQAGDASLDSAINDQVSEDLGAAADFSLPITLIILLVAFGAIVAAGVPVLLALSSVGAATGLASLVSHLIPDSGTTSSMILLMGMAVGVDYSLFYVKRARAERRSGTPHLDAIEIAAETAGHSVLVSGGAVIVSMLGLFLARDAIFASLAAGSIIVVAVAVLGSLTVLPALLVVLGRAIDRPRAPLLWRLSAQTREPRLWPRLLAPALRQPAKTLAVAAIALIALALPATTMRLHSDSLASLPDSIAAKATFQRLQQAFPATATTDTVVVRAPAGQASAVQSRLSQLAERSRGNPLFTGEASIRASADATVHRLDLSTPFDAESAQAKQGVAQLRGLAVPDALAGLSDAQWAVGGDTAGNVDTDRHLSGAIWWVIGFVVLTTMLIMAWVFRSLLLALVTAVVNLLSVGAAFGVLVLVFQHSWAEGLLHFSSTGALINWIPLFTFAVLFGLSMDYHVFVLNQIREAAQSGMSTPEAVRAGITRSAGTVTSAALVMVSVFTIFASLHMIEMKELGVGLAVAVLIDALVVRVLVLPSLLILLAPVISWRGSGRARWPHRSELFADAHDLAVLGEHGVGVDH